MSIVEFNSRTSETVPSKKLVWKDKGSLTESNLSRRMTGEDKCLAKTGELGEFSKTASVLSGPVWNRPEERLPINNLFEPDFQGGGFQTFGYVCVDTTRAGLIKERRGIRVGGGLIYESESFFVDGVGLSTRGTSCSRA